MKAEPPGRRAARSGTQPYATGTRPRRGSLGGTHLPDLPVPPAQTRLGEVFQASKRFGFALSQGNRSHTLAGGILTAAERLRRKDCTPMPWQKTGAAAPAE